MKFTLNTLALTLAFAAPAQAQIASLDLADYRLVATYELPAVRASEASAITWNWDTDTLFVVGDEGEYVVEVNKQGQQIGSMTLSGFDDTEGLTYVGNGQFAIVEERVQDVSLFTYQAGGTVSRNTLPSVSVGPTVGNVGLEDLSYDPLAGRFVLVKEKVPQAVYDAALNFSNGSASVTELLPPANQSALIFGTQDLSGVQVLSTVQSLRGTADQDNFLVYSQETPRLMEVSRSGAILSSFDFSAIAGDAEGVTIDGNGIIYIVGETPRMYVLAPVPEPETALLMLTGLGLIGAAARRRRT